MQLAKTRAYPIFAHSFSSFLPAMPKSTASTTAGTYETDSTSVHFNFLDCSCQCCGEKQTYTPEQSTRSHQQVYATLLKAVIKPRYALDCTCRCGPDRRQLTAFATDTGIRRFNQSGEANELQQP